MCKSNITLKKFVKLLAEIMFYRIIISSVFWITGYSDFAIKILIKTLIPIKEISNNFTGAYLLFFLLIPFLNKLINNMSEKQHSYLIILLLFIYVLYGSFSFLYIRMNYISWFCVLYIISSYVRLYPKDIYKNTKFWMCFSILSITLCVLSIFISVHKYKNLAYYYIFESNKFLALLTGFCTFMFFKNLNIKYNRFINAVASTTFGVLLIHANSDTMRQWLWVDLLDNVGVYNSDLIYVHAILSTLCIFAVCSVIDYLRIKFVEKYGMILFDKLMLKIKPEFDKIENNICNKFNIKKD